MRETNWKGNWKEARDDVMYSLGKEFESYSTDKGKPLEYLKEVNYMIKFR